MFKEIEDRLDITNDLLRKIEKHLRDLKKNCTDQQVKQK